MRPKPLAKEAGRRNFSEEVSTGATHDRYRTVTDGPPVALTRQIH
jgi:hypothetical protein